MGLAEMIFHTEGAPKYIHQKCIIKISTQLFQALNDTLVSLEHNAVEISLENKVLAVRIFLQKDTREGGK